MTRLAEGYVAQGFLLLCPWSIAVLFALAAFVCMFWCRTRVTSRWLAVISLLFSAVVFFTMRSREESWLTRHDSPHHDDGWHWWPLGMVPLLLAIGVIAAAATPVVLDGRPSTKSYRRDCFLRLLTGGSLNFVLVGLALGLHALGSGLEQEYYFHFIGAAIASLILVVLVPVIWRGTPLEIIFALEFAMPPIYRLYGAYEFWQQIRWGCC